MQDAAKPSRRFDQARFACLGQLLPGIAHELNSPLQYLNDSVHFLRDAWQDLQPMLVLLQQRNEAGAMSPEECARLLDLAVQGDLPYLIEEMPNALAQASEGVARVGAIVAAVARCARGSADERTRIDVNRLVEDLLTASFNETKYVADVVSDLGQGVPAISGVAGEICLVVLELLLDAGRSVAARRHANQDEGRGQIAIETISNGNDVEISVVDRGPVLSSPPLPVGETDGAVGDASRWHVVREIVSRHDGTLRVQPGLAEKRVTVALPAAI